MNRRPQISINISGRQVALGKKSVIMGVVNVTPDSFSDGGLYLKPGSAIRRALALAQAGADWIDIGGESTRPGALPVTAREEIRRVIPVIRGIRARLPALPISIDTTKAEVAEAALRAGAAILNDVSGLRFDPGIAGVAASYRVPLILMHTRGRPRTMQSKRFVKSIWQSLLRGLAGSVRRAQRSGVRRSQLIIDPGLGFGKSRRQNFEILAHLHRLNRFGLPILIGASRKSFVQGVAGGEGVDSPAAGRTLWPITTASRRRRFVSPTRDVARRLSEGEILTRLDLADAAMAAAAILAGAHIIRVHHAEAVLPAVRLADALLATG